MTKYNEEVLNAAGDSVAIGHRLTNQRIAIAVFDSLERAPWWEEVEVGYGFMPDEPYRNESPNGIASEHTATHTFTVLPVLKNTYFRDTRWTPPPAPLAVGDVIGTVEDLERLPEETLLFSTRLHAYWMEKEGHFIAIGSDRWLVADEAVPYGPFTIRWLPEPEVTE